jgi:hypothetical protein
MGGGNDDKSFPYFEGTIFSGWLKQFMAVLREFDCDEMIETPIPKDVDANGNPIVMNAREIAEFDRKLKQYKDKDKIAYPKIMQACLRILRLRVCAKQVISARQMKFWFVFVSVSTVWMLWSKLSIFSAIHP